MKATTIFFPYRINDNKIGVVVSYDWIKTQITKGQLIIDPLVTNSASKAQSTITGSKYSSPCYTQYCSYELSVPALLNVVLTDVRFSFNYNAIAPCAVEDGGFSLHFSSCKSPFPVGVYKCNLPSAGICIGAYSMFSHMSGCLDSVYCAPTDLEFEMRFYRCADTTSDCGSNCIAAASDLIITLEGNSAEIINAVLDDNEICQGESVTGSISYANGAAPYTHVWSLNSDGSEPLGYGENPTFTPSTPGSHLVYVITTNACGNQFRDSLPLMVHPSYTIVEYDTVCSSELPITWHGSTIYSGSSSAAVYHLTTTNGCDSNTVLNLHVTPTITATETLSICAAMLPYTWNGITVTSGGYSVATYTNTSVISGCDSTTYLNLIISPVLNAYHTVNICHTELPYTWNGNTYTIGGTAVDTFESISITSGCDSITILNLNVHYPTTTSLTQYFCEGSDLVEGVYIDTFSSIYGCDSIAIITLIKEPIDTFIVNDSMCSGATYTWFEMELTDAGIYNHLSTSGSCDTLWQLNLTYKSTIQSYSSYWICTGDSISWADTVIYDGGTYYFYGINAEGCDTLHTVYLNTYPIDTIIQYAYICPLDTLSFYGLEITSPGTYNYTEYTPCIVVYILQVLPNDTLYSYDYVYICSGGNISYGGVTINEEGVYNFYGVNASGCDTVHTLYVYETGVQYFYHYETICEENSYLFFEDTIVTAGTYYHYSATGCDTTWVLYLSTVDTIRTYTSISICQGDGYEWNGVYYNTPGTYYLAGTNSEGCDTAHTITIYVSPIDTMLIYETTCPGIPYDFFGTPISSTGTYYYNDTIGYCDTVWKLTISVFDTIITTYNDTLCSGNTYTWHGVTYDASGVYNLYGVNATGCDTLHQITLYFIPPDTIITDATICSGNEYYFYGTYYNTTGTYYHYTTSGICDVSYQLNLLVNDTIRTITYDRICSGMYLFFNDEYLITTGEYNYYGVNVYGCDTLRTINLYVEPTYMDSTWATICPGESYVFYGLEYSDAGIYTRSSITEGCDTAYVLILNVPSIPNLHDSFEICNKDRVVHDKNVLRESGVYVFVYTSIDGCDSNYTITLNVVPYITDSIFDTVCSNQSYVFFDSIIYNEGVYYHLTLGEQCDTMHILTLNHLPIYRFEQDITLCRNKLPYTYLDLNIPMDAMSTALFDSTMLTTTEGCDSLIVINLTVLDTSRTNLDTTLCHGTYLEFGSHTISTPGIYLDTLMNNNGCDSIIALSVQYTPAPLIKDTFMRNCEYVIYRDSTFYQSTQFIDTFRDEINCDSLYRYVNIEVLRVVRDTISAAICQGEKYYFNNRTFTSSTTVTDSFLNDNGCDSFITLQLTVHPLPNVGLTINPLLDLCIFDSVDISGTGAEIYKYYDKYERYLGEGEIIKAILPGKENTFYVIGQDHNGCVDTASYTIFAEVCCEMLMPNAFTPNGDGVNDEYGPVTFGNPLNYNFTIFNRWGEVVFVSFKVEDKWDGIDSRTGKPADLGTYFYYITGKCYDDTPLNIKGDVTLLR